jgi:hypothetical protein
MLGFGVAGQARNDGGVWVCEHPIGALPFLRVVRMHKPACLAEKYLTKRVLRRNLTNY